MLSCTEGNWSTAQGCQLTGEWGLPWVWVLALHIWLWGLGCKLFVFSTLKWWGFFWLNSAVPFPFRNPLMFKGLFFFFILMATPSIWKFLTKGLNPIAAASIYATVTATLVPLPHCAGPGIEPHASAATPANAVRCLTHCATVGTPQRAYFKICEWRYSRTNFRRGRKGRKLILFEEIQHSDREHGLWDQIPTQPIVVCVTLDSWRTLSPPPFSHLQNGNHNKTSQNGNKV